MSTVSGKGNQSWFETWNRSNDTMTNVNEVIRTIEKYTIEKDGQKVKLLKPEEAYLDDIGIGRGPSDRLKELGMRLTA